MVNLPQVSFDLFCTVTFKQNGRTKLAKLANYTESGKAGVHVSRVCSRFERIISIAVVLFNKEHHY